MRDGGARPAPNRPGTVPTVAEPSDTAVDRLRARLLDPDALFTTSEVAYLMSTAGRWGYEHRVDEENGAYPPAPVRLGLAWMDQVDYRRRCDAQARQPRLGDHRGGPVAWDVE